MSNSPKTVALDFALAHGFTIRKPSGVPQYDLFETNPWTGKEVPAGGATKYPAVLHAMERHVAARDVMMHFPKNVVRDTPFVLPNGAKVLFVQRSPWAIQDKDGDSHMFVYNPVLNLIQRGAVIQTTVTHLSIQSNGDSADTCIEPFMSVPVKPWRVSERIGDEWKPIMGATFNSSHEAYRYCAKLRNSGAAPLRPRRVEYAAS